MIKNISDLFKSKKYVEDRLVGWLLGATQNSQESTTILLTNDSNTIKVGGILAHCFLLAYPQVNNSKEGAVLLLRLIGSLSLKQEIQRETLLQLYQNIPQAHLNLLGDDLTSLNEKNKTNLAPQLDIHTHDFLSFGGYECDILGSFYENEQGQLTFGGDIEYFPSACMYSVIKPTDIFLKDVLDVIKRSKKSSNHNIMISLGFKYNEENTNSFKIGSLRYSATRNLQKIKDLDDATVCFGYDEIISKRVAVFGMTRTGKSNMIKKMITSLHVGTLQRDIKFGQIVFDINGEYANSNNQDSGSIADAFGNLAVIYSPNAHKLNNKQIKEICPDFYTDLQFGLTLIQKKIKKGNGGANSEAFRGFMDLSFSGNYGDDDALRELRKFLYRGLLFKAGYEYREEKNIHNFPEHLFYQPNKSGFDFTLFDKPNNIQKPRNFMEIKKWTEFLQNNNNFFENLHPEIKNLVSLINGRGTTGYLITGLSYIASSINQHSANLHTKEFKKTDEILFHVKNGKLVIIDLSYNSPTEQNALMEEYAKTIFADYSLSFKNINSSTPPCLIYIEEAHNMLGVELKSDEIWPRIAREGAKYGLGLVYATQQPTSIQKDILSNTENIIVCHLNNKREVREICDYFDFKPFEGSIIKIQEPGFVRIKQLDLPFVIPVQIDKFDVLKSKDEIEKALSKTNIKYEDDKDIIKDTKLTPTYNSNINKLENISNYSKDDNQLLNSTELNNANSNKNIETKSLRKFARSRKGKK